MKKVKKILWKLASIEGSHHSIAMGVAVGIFISVTPTIPFHTLFAIILAFFIKANKKAAIIAVWFSNPITIPLFYAGAYYAGTFIMGIDHSNIQLIYTLLDKLQSDIGLNAKTVALADFFKAELSIFYAMIVGGIVLGIIPGIISYFLTRSWLKKIRNNEDLKNTDDSTI